MKRDLPEASRLGTEGFESQGEWRVAKILELVSHFLQSHHSGEVDWTIFMVPNTGIRLSYSVTGPAVGDQGVEFTGGLPYRTMHSRNFRKRIPFGGANDGRVVDSIP